MNQKSVGFIWVWGGGIVWAFFLFVLNIHMILFQNSKILAVEYLKETASRPVLFNMINKENNKNQYIQWGGKQGKTP